MNRLNAEHLPPKLTQVVCCALTPTQRRMYEHVLKARDDELALRGTAKDTLGFIQRLQKVCNHPQVACEDASFNPLGAQLADLLPRDAGRPKGRGGRALSAFAKPCDFDMSGKMRVLHRLMKALREAPGPKERIVVVSVYTTTLDLLEAMCAAEGWPCCKLGGSTPAKKRKQFNDEFNRRESGYFAFLLSSKAGGCGLNLIGGSRLVMFDLDWNPATDKQAAARCWRDGQKMQCFTYRLVSTGTLEERMLQRQLAKEGLQNVIEDKEQVNHFAADDLKRLFLYRPDTASDLHDELGCAVCRGKHAAKKADGESKLALGPESSKVCLDEVHKLAAEFGAHFSTFSAPEGCPKAAMQKCKPHVDLGGVLAGLSRGEYSWIPHLLKDLNRIPKNAGVLWSEEPSEAGEAHRGAALQFARRVGDVWPGLVERCYEANALAASVSSSAPSSGVVDDENGATGGEEGPYSKQQLYPLPKEEDLNNWSHHSSLETVADPIFRRAMRGLPGAVSFVFGMYQDWQLIQADSALEAAKKAPPAATDDDEAEEGCAPLKRSPPFSASPTARRRKVDCVLADASNSSPDG